MTGPNWMIWALRSDRVAGGLRGHLAELRCRSQCNRETVAAG